MSNAYTTTCCRVCSVPIFLRVSIPLFSQLRPRRSIRMAMAHEILFYAIVQVRASLLALCLPH
jgi:hypothetical protein